MRASSATVAASISSISQEKNVTIDDIVKEANTVYAKCKEMRLVGTTPDTMLEIMHREHKQFGQAYPIVMRYMCDMGMYSPKALRRYMRWLQHHQWKSEAEFLDAQARYVRVLHEELYPHTAQNKLDEIYNGVRSLLEKEYTDLKTVATASEKEVVATEAELKARAKDQFLEFCRMHGQILTDIKVVCVSETPMHDIPDIDDMFSDCR